MFRAVIVGIDKYLDTFIQPLSCAAADARALAGLIRGRVDKPEQCVHLLVDGDATLQNIRTLIVDDVASKVEEDDVVLLYFACHGSPERTSPRAQQARYLIAHDTQYRKIHGTAFHMEREVAVWFEELKVAKLVVLILDACFSGAAGGRSFMGPTLAQHPKLQGLMDDPRPISLKGRDLGSGRIILCAADADQLAIEELPVGHGVFTRHLLAALKKPRVGVSDVTLTTLYDEIDEGVRRDTHGAQEPVATLIQNKHASLPSFASEESAT